MLTKYVAGQPPVTGIEAHFLDANDSEVKHLRLLATLLALHGNPERISLIEYQQGPAIRLQDNDPQLVEILSAVTLSVMKELDVKSAVLRRISSAIKQLRDKEK